MNAAKKKAADKDLVLGLGSTGLSIARYLRRAERDAVFMDTRDEPPGVDELEELFAKDVEDMENSGSASASPPDSRESAG